MRPSGRQADELRQVSITRNYTCHAEGSVLIACGNTKVLCTASVESRVPPFCGAAVKAGLRLNTACCRDRPVRGCDVKPHRASRVGEPWKFNG